MGLGDTTQASGQTGGDGVNNLKWDWSLCWGTSVIVQNNHTLLEVLSCLRLPNSAWLVSTESQKCVHVSFALLLPGGAIKAQRTWTARKRTPLSESSECSGFSNTDTHPTNKLCESSPGYFSAHILSKRTKDNSDIASNKIKRGHHCANLHLTPWLC